MHAHVRHLRPLAAIIAAVATLLALIALSPTASAATPPGSPTGLTPDGDTQNAIPVLSWDRQDDATTYDVQVSASSTFSSSLYTQNGTYNDKVAPTKQLPLGTIYWRVRAHSSAGYSDWSSASFTHTAASPPDLIAPADDATLQEGDDTPVFQWSPVAGATGYVVRIGQDPDFTDPSRYVTLDKVQAQAGVLVGLLKPNTYYWEVQAQLGTGYSTDWSSPRTLTIQALDQPSLQGPPDDINNAVQDVVLNWTAVPGAATYNLQVSTDANFNTVVVNATKITGTRYSPPITIGNDQYYWRVVPVDASGFAADWSQAPIWHFQRNWPDQPTLEYPQNNATVGDPFYFQWTPVHRASEYVVQVAGNPDFTGIVSTCLTAGTTVTPDQVYPGHSSTLGCMPSATGTYYWRVQAVDQPAGVVSDVLSAQVGKFTYVPQTVTQETPAAGATDVTVPTLTWDPVAGAASYRVTLVDTVSNDTTTVTTSSLSYTPRSLLVPGDSYQWNVQTIGADGRLGAVPLQLFWPSFTMSSTPLTGSASTPEPTDTPTSERFPTLTWTPVTGASIYKVYVRPTGSLSYTQLSGSFAYPAAEDVTDSNMTPGTYDWMVVPIDGDGKQMTPTVEPGQYTISALSQPATYAVGLTGNAITGNAGTTVDSCPSTLPSSCQNLRSTPVLNWPADPNISMYKLYISYDAEMTHLFTTSPISVYGTMWSDTAELPDSQAGSAYYWEVVPCMTANNCGPLQHAQLAFNKQSDAVVLDSPVSPDPGNPTTVANDVTLSWQDYLDSEQSADDSGTSLSTPGRIGPKQYRVQVSTTPDFSSLIESNTVVDQTTFTSTATTYPEGPLYWRVQAIDDTGNNLNWSDTGTFVKTSPAPTMTYPVNDGGGIPNVNGTNSFTWDTQTFAKSYDIQVYKNDDLIGQSGNLVFSKNTPGTAYAPSSLLPASGTPYTWRVRREDAAGRPGPWSALQEFRVVGDSPTLTSPVNGTHEAPNDTLFTWLASTNAATYRFELRQAGSSTDYENVSTANTSWAEPKALATGDWQWRVTAVDANGKDLGAAGNWTDMQFTVDGSVLATNDVSISGTSAVGSLLTAMPPTWNVSGVTTTYQWLRDGATIRGATDTSYTLTQADIGHKITLRATGTKAAYAAGTSLSSEVDVTAGPAPVASPGPTVTGSKTVGQVLTAHAGGWPSGARLSYQWLRNGAAISRATGSTYRLQTADATKKISVRVTAVVTGLKNGVATSPAVTIAKMTSKTSGTLQAASVSHKKRAKVNVVIVVSGLAGPTGKVTIKQGHKTVGSVTLKARNHGRKTITLKRLGKGKHKLKVVYAGSSTVKGSSSKRIVLHVT